MKTGNRPAALLLALTLIAGLFSSCQSKPAEKEAGYTADGYEYLAAHKGDDAFPSLDLTESADRYVVGLHLPKTGVDELDEALSDKGESMISNFKNDVSAMSFDPSADGKAVLFGDWSAVDYGGRYLSVLVKTDLRTPTGGEKAGAFSFCYDKTEKKLVKLRALAANDVLVPFKTAIHTVLKDDENYKEYLTDSINMQALKDKLDDKLLEDTAMTIGGEGITFYFTQDSLLPARFGLVTATIPAARYTTLLSADARKGLPGMEEGSSTSSDSSSSSSSSGSGDGPKTPSVPKGTPGAIALTFDDGPKKSTTMRLLDILKKYGAKATFFMLGVQIEEYPSVAKAVIDAGHEVGLHSYKHQAYSKMQPDQVKADLKKTSDLLYNAADYTASIIRTPYGERTKAVLGMVGYPVILWNIDPEDWKVKDAEKVANHIIENATAGDIILMHDIYSTSVDAAEIILKTLSQKGFTFVTVSELLSEYGVEEVAGAKYTSARQ